MVPEIHVVTLTLKKSRNLRRNNGAKDVKGSAMNLLYNYEHADLVYPSSRPAISTTMHRMFSTENKSV